MPTREEAQKAIMDQMIKTMVSIENYMPIIEAEGAVHMAFRMADNTLALTSETFQLEGWDPQRGLTPNESEALANYLLDSYARLEMELHCLAVREVPGAFSAYQISPRQGDDSILFQVTCTPTSFNDYREELEDLGEFFRDGQSGYRTLLSLAVASDPNWAKWYKKQPEKEGTDI